MVVCLITFSKWIPIEFFRQKDFCETRSQGSKDELPFSGFVGIEHLLKYTDSSKGHSPEVTIVCKIWIVIIPKNSVLCMSDPSDLRIVKNRIYW